MGSIYPRIYLKASESSHKNIYPWMDITNEKAANTEYRWVPLRRGQTDEVIAGKEVHPICLRNRGQTKMRKILTLEGGWYRCHSI